ncbi:hypothetical protein M7I_5378 [Glarea lozoyensis 74030]|uniref:Uncharacterized protein n=1 Tax=Glarea lozoyensis (strain ATCC 74030 / MF5533) TaxID=1104152 RepID=H0ERQ7_GLAL7|nr:hypothetical protein M7I_5378 [Glarea lozoyensis 74030]
MILSMLPTGRSQQLRRLFPGTTPKAKSDKAATDTDGSNKARRENVARALCTQLSIAGVKRFPLHTETLEVWERIVKGV